MFTGFTPETVDFLWGIRMNNNRDWFLAHKEQYVRTLYEPMKALGEDLFQPFLTRSGDVLHVSRIYRDARMHPPEPYKDSLWLSIRRDGEWWGENPCLYFDINPDGVNYGFSIWKPRPFTMEEFRRTISANPREFLELIQSTEETVGMPVTAGCYKRPRPCEDPELARFFAWKDDISCVIHEPFREETFGPALGERVLAHFEGLIPLYNYFTRFQV